MDVEAILELTWVPLIVFAMCLMYGLLLVISKNPRAITSKKNPRPIRDEKMYALRGGQLLLFLAVGAFLNCWLLFVNLTFALVEAVTWFLVFAFLWKRVSDKYGPIV